MIYFKDWEISHDGSILARQYDHLSRLLRNGAAAYGVRDVILVGGVGSNKYIRKHVEEKLAKRRVRLWVPEGRFSCDNASGCAAVAWRLHKKND